MTKSSSPFDLLRPMGRLQILDDLTQAPESECVLSVMGSATGFDSLAKRTSLTVLGVREISQRQLDTICSISSLEGLSIWGFRGASLAALKRLPHLKVLSIGWAPKLERLDDVGALTNLEGLGITDMRRVEELGPLAKLVRLRALAISGSFTKAQWLRSLDPIMRLETLTELSLDGVRVADEDLRPVARMRQLQTLHLGNGFQVREYARLSVALSHIDCDAFRPTRSISHMTFDPVLKQFVTHPSLGDTVLIARPIKMVNPAEAKGAALVAKRVAEHERWQAHFRSVSDPAADWQTELPAEGKTSKRRTKRRSN